MDDSSSMLSTHHPLGLSKTRERGTWSNEPPYGSLHQDVHQEVACGARRSAVASARRRASQNPDRSESDSDTDSPKRLRLVKRGHQRRCRQSASSSDRAPYSSWAYLSLYPVPAAGFIVPFPVSLSFRLFTLRASCRRAAREPCTLVLDSEA